VSSLQRREVVPLVLMILTVGLMTFSPAVAERGSYPGVNGKIAFDVTYPNATDRQIFVMNPDGTDVKQLTHPPEQVTINNAAWSPDGSKITFTIDGNPGPTPGGIWIMKLDEPDWQQWIPIYTTGTMTLDVVGPAWSPDGSKIAFTKQQGPLVAVMPAVRDATSTDLTNGTSPHWSPDGTEIVLTRLGDIYAVDSASGTTLRQLTGLSGQAAGGHNFEPCWSPDGSKIVFSSGAGIWVISTADGTILAKLTSNANDIQPNWSPDGRKIAFARYPPGGAREYGPSSIWVMNADGSDPTELTSWGLNPGIYVGPRNPDWQRLPAPSQAFGVGSAFAVMGIGAGVAAVVAAFAVAAARRAKPEVFTYAGQYYCSKHRVPVWRAQGGYWCPVERRFLNP